MYFGKGDSNTMQCTHLFERITVHNGLINFLSWRLTVFCVVVVVVVVAVVVVVVVVVHCK